MEKEKNIIIMVEYNMKKKIYKTKKIKIYKLLFKEKYM